MFQSSSRLAKYLWSSAAILAAYLAVSYFLLPDAWKVVDRNVDATTATMITRTASDIPGDPINVGLIGGIEDVLRAFAASEWDTANPVTLKTAAAIGLSVLFDKPYPDAPVSPLYFEGRKQELAFEKPSGSSADKRHHVRFWRASDDAEGRPLWLGSATFDRSVGLSHDTGQITHHIDPNIDAERDGLIDDLKKHGQIVSTFTMDGSGQTRAGRNGEGDHYFTDGKALIGRLRTGARPVADQREPAAVSRDP